MGSKKTGEAADIISEFAAMRPNVRATWADTLPPETLEKLSKLRSAFHAGKLPNFGGKAQTLAKTMIRTFSLPVSVFTVVRWLEEAKSE